MQSQLDMTPVALWSSTGELRCSQAIVGREDITFPEHEAVQPGDLLAFFSAGSLEAYAVTRVSRPTGRLISDRIVAAIEPAAFARYSVPMRTGDRHVNAGNITITASGPGSQAGIDNSMQQSWENKGEPKFTEILSGIAASPLEETTKQELIALVREHQDGGDPETSSSRYLRLLAALADHKEVLGPTLPSLVTAIDTCTNMLANIL